jgi:hypothetical protein
VSLVSQISIERTLITSPSHLEKGKEFSSGSKRSSTVGLNPEGALEIIHTLSLLIFYISMPYAQLHYPFENAEKFENAFPADFVSEGIDQTRGWFYTLLVLSTHIFGKAPWKNLIVTGLVLARLRKYHL